MIDAQGFRKNVGIIVANRDNELLWARRVGKADAWQLPQGGILKDESPKRAMYRELREELGLSPEDVECLGVTQGWLSYSLPKAFRRYYSKPLCVGQKQKWFLLRLKCADSCIKFDCSDRPEFDDWRWVDYWYPPKHVISFKKQVYTRALRELEALLVDTTSG